MYYVDTSVLISYVFASDTGHKISRIVLERIVNEQKQKLYGSAFTLVEVCNIICRKIVKEKDWRLIDPLQKYVEMLGNYEDKCRFLLSLILNFLKERLGIAFVDHESFYEFEGLDLDKSSLLIPKVFKESIKMSYKLAIKIKDLLHLTYAYMLSKTFNIKYFLTRDVENFEKVKDVVKQLLQIEVILVK